MLPIGALQRHMKIMKAKKSSKRVADSRISSLSGIDEEIRKIESTLAASELAVDVYETGIPSSTTADELEIDDCTIAQRDDDGQIVKFVSINYNDRIAGLPKSKLPAHTCSNQGIRKQNGNKRKYKDSECPPSPKLLKRVSFPDCERIHQPTNSNIHFQEFSNKVPFFCKVGMLLFYYFETVY